MSAVFFFTFSKCLLLILQMPVNEEKPSVPIDNVSTLFHMFSIVMWRVVFKYECLIHKDMLSKNLRVRNFFWTLSWYVHIKYHGITNESRAKWYYFKCLIIIKLFNVYTIYLFSLVLKQV